MIVTETATGRLDGLRREDLVRYGLRRLAGEDRLLPVGLDPLGPVDGPGAALDRSAGDGDVVAEVSRTLKARHNRSGRAGTGRVFFRQGE